MCDTANGGPALEGARVVGEDMSREEAASSGGGSQVFERVWPRRFSLEELRALLGEEVDDLICDAISERVNRPLWELVERGGKRWRSIVGRLAYRVAGGEGEAPSEVFEVVELLQDASLIVDDIEDDASERRGGLPIHLSCGLPVALNAANAAYFRALVALKPRVPDAMRLRALDMIAEELFAAHLGQALDLSLGAAAQRGAPVGEPHYVVLVRAKTGALIRIAARLAAIVAGASAEVEGTLATWAGEVGIAYQIRDDLEDLAGEGSDRAAGRLSYPIVRALARTAREGGASDQPDDRPRSSVERAALDESLAASRAAADRAVAALLELPAGEARDALVALTRRLAEG